MALQKPVDAAQAVLLHPLFAIPCCPTWPDKLSAAIHKLITTPKANPFRSSSPGCPATFAFTAITLYNPAGSACSLWAMHDTFAGRQAKRGPAASAIMVSRHSCDVVRQLSSLGKLVARPGLVQHPRRLADFRRKPAWMVHAGRGQLSVMPS